MKFEDIKDFVDQNQKLLIVILTSIGVSYQVANLLIISADSIKFFSLTSAISDSIIVALNIIILFILICLYRIIIGIIFTNFSLLIVDYKHNKLSSFFEKYNFLVYLLIMVILFIIRNYYNINSIYLNIILTISIYTLFYVFFFDLVPRIKEVNINNYFGLISMILIISSPFIFPKFNELYDKKFMNIENYKNKLLLDKDINSVNVQYYNDKYIFIIIKKSSSNEEYLLVKDLKEML